MLAVIQQKSLEAIVCKQAAETGEAAVFHLQPNVRHWFWRISIHPTAIGIESPRSQGHKFGGAPGVFEQRARRLMELSQTNLSVFREREESRWNTKGVRYPISKEVRRQ
jgi:hypothetical protein